MSDQRSKTRGNIWTDWAGRLPLRRYYSRAEGQAFALRDICRMKLRGSAGPEAKFMKNQAAKRPKTLKFLIFEILKIRHFASNLNLYIL